MIEAEIAVIGSGPGGAVTAAAMAEAGRDVILVEMGKYHGPESCPPFSVAEMEQKYRNGGLTPALGKPNVMYVEASCVGGGSEINSGLYHRLPAEISGYWKDAFGVVDVDQTHLAEHYEAIERDLSVSYMPGELPAASLKLAEGAARLGWKAVEVPRWFKYNGNNQGIRQSMTRTLIPRCIRAGCSLLTQTKAIKLHRTRKAWHIIARSTVSSEKTVIRARYVFVCCGAVHTAALLRRSGINRNIGNTLRLHPTVKVVARFAEKVNREDMGIPVHQVKQFSPAYSFGCSVSSVPFLALGMVDQPSHMRQLERDWEHFAAYYAMIYPKGTGTVRNLPFCDDPVVTYRLEDEDMHLLAQALRDLCLLLFEAGAERLYPGAPDIGVLYDRQDVARIPRALSRKHSNLMTIHLFSSCPMGRNTDVCAADSFGKVFGYDGLYINDASLLPSAVSVNPQGAIMAIARRNAFHFLEAAG